MPHLDGFKTTPKVLAQHAPIEAAVVGTTVIERCRTRVAHRFNSLGGYGGVSQCEVGDRR